MRGFRCILSRLNSEDRLEVTGNAETRIFSLLSTDSALGLRFFLIQQLRPRAILQTAL